MTGPATAAAKRPQHQDGAMSHSIGSEGTGGTQEARDPARLAAELEALNTEFQEFAYIVSHDLRAPLRAVSQLATWLQEDHAEGLSQDGKELIDLLLGRLGRLNNLLEGIQHHRIFESGPRFRHSQSDGFHRIHAPFDLLAILLEPCFCSEWNALLCLTKWHWG